MRVENLAEDQSILIALKRLMIKNQKQIGEKTLHLDCVFYGMMKFQVMYFLIFHFNHFRIELV